MVLQTAEKCRAAGASKVETHAADLTDVDGRERLISELLAKHTTVDVLVNNAGMGVKGTPLEGATFGSAAWQIGSGCCIATRHHVAFSDLAKCVHPPGISQATPRSGRRCCT